MSGESAFAAGSETAFKAFLSHRYRSAQVNQYFYGICSDVAETQFEIDGQDGPISVARLSRMVRSADAFVGIYPFPAAPNTVPSREDLSAASRYFRLELGLAARARIPMLVFHDERYRSTLSLPGSAFRQTFDPQEILGHGGMPSAQRYRRVVQDFGRTVSAHLAYRAEVPRSDDATAVGLLLPPEQYGAGAVDALVDAVEARGYEALVLDWPLSVDIATLRQLESLDWLALDTGNSHGGAAALGWLDGRGLPVVRMQRRTADDGSAPQIESALYRGVEVGYTEDRLLWSDPADLISRFEQVIDVITAPTVRISTAREAESYFSGAERRPLKVFLSYASEDQVIAAQISAELKTKCDVVFDYRDGESMVPGLSYPAQLYDRLADSDIGIPLLSAAYLTKGTCLHEARDMVASLDSGRMFVYPINIDGTKPPSYLRSLQYELFDARNADPELTVHRVLRGYDEWRVER